MKHRYSTSLLYLLLLLSTASSSAVSQKVPHQPKLGRPLLRYFPPAEYSGAVQVWCALQDLRGVLYFGNSNAVLEYDGVNWRKIRVPTVARSLAMDRHGKIWVGAVTSFGSLEPDANGLLQYVSLFERIPEEHRAFNDVWQVLVAPSGTFFRSYAKLFRWDGQRMHVWSTKTRFEALSEVRGRIYTSQVGIGLQEIVGDELRDLPGGSAWQDSRKLFLYPYDERRILITAQRETLSLYDGDTRIPFVTQVDEDLRKSEVYTSSLLPNGDLCVNTFNGGAFILDPNGRLRMKLNRDAGLPTQAVQASLLDREGALWLGLATGIARVDINSPISVIVREGVTDVIRSGESLYLASPFVPPGIFRLDLTERPGVASLKPLTSLNRQAFWFFEFKDPGGQSPQLLVAASNGVMSITGDRVSPIVRKDEKLVEPARRILQSRKFPHRVFVGGSTTIFSLRWQNGSWVDEGSIPTTSNVDFLVEEDDGTLWAGTRVAGVLRVTVPDTGMKDSIVERFGAKDGLGKEGHAVLLVGKDVFVVPLPTKRMFRWDPTGRRFVEDNRFLIGSADPDAGANLVVMPNGDIFADNGSQTDHRMGMFRRQPDGAFKFEEEPFRGLAPFQIVTTYLDSSGDLLIAGTDGLLRFDPSAASRTVPSFGTLVRRVTTGPEDIVFGGVDVARASAPSLAYSRNSLHFEFGAPVFAGEGGLRYRYRLEGSDSDWSAWGKLTEANYNNLGPGSYRFMVQARSHDGRIGEPGSFSFTVLPPWYRTWWAYGLYALILAVGVFATDRIQRRRLLARERERSTLREAQLRAETAAAEAKTLQAENERNKNVGLLSEIGKELTSSLDLETIFFRLYQHVNELMDASIFGVGIYHAERKQIEYPLAIEKGKRYAAYTRDASDRNQFPVWCIENRQPVFINDVSTEYSKYIQSYAEPGTALEDGGDSIGRATSFMYLPLLMKDKVMGVITVQSFEKNAYTRHHLDLLENLASYTSIALDNADAYQRLKSAREQLVVQEKLASLGALTAGIAHEIKNPLNFVNNFADLSLELMSELREDLQKHQSAIPADTYENLESLIDDLSSNARKINEHGKRADGIVRSMLLHSRGQVGERQPTDINSMLDEYVNLAYHGMRAQDSSFNVTIEREFADDVGKVDAIAQDLSRVFLNLLSNACHAVSEKAKQNGGGYTPTLTVRSVNLVDAIEVRIRDNGTGIPPEVRDKIFNPFFTTKPTGQGTGLGLSISHDIVVQEHGGQLEVESEPGVFTEFVVRLPRKVGKAA